MPDLEKEIKELQKLMSKGHTIRELSEMFGKSNYYIYSRLNRKYGRARGYKNLALVIRGIHQNSKTKTIKTLFYWFNYGKGHWKIEEK